MQCGGEASFDCVAHVYHGVAEAFHEEPQGLISLNKFASNFVRVPSLKDRLRVYGTCQWP